jgi:hypothetical protein
LKIEAVIIAHSACATTGKEIITWELTYPRIIHSEFMTHRMFSRNAASSRAIPVAKMLEMVREHPAMPVRFGANQAGMQDKGVGHGELVFIEDRFYFALSEGLPVSEAKEFALVSAATAWQLAAENASNFAEAFSDAGYHKQVGNRLIEPFQWMKTVMTTTEDANWFWLRDHKDADPTIEALAIAMREAKKLSKAVTLKSGEWHTPYYAEGFWKPEHKDTEGWYDKSGMRLEDALAISSSCCAQVSYRKLDDTLEKAQMVYERLVGSEPVHASPFEHQATPMAESEDEWGVKIVNKVYASGTWEKGITHVDRQGNFWSGNFKGWIQHRQLIPNNVCNEYKEQ